MGRDDFPDALVLSRQHLKFAVERGQLTVRELGSRNGTSLHGEPLVANQPTPLKEGDVLWVRDLEFKVEWTRPHFQLGLAAVGFILLMKVLDPNAGYGRAIGAYGWVAFVLSAGLASAVVTPVLNLLVPRAHRWAYPVALILMASAVDLGALLYASRVTPLLDRVARTRIEYHCGAHFNARRCITQVESCPRCAIGIDKWRREQIAQRIETVNRTPAGRRR